MGHSITYRIATGPNAGRKVLTLQTLPAIEDEGSSRVASMDGFSLHGGVATQAHERGIQKEKHISEEKSPAQRRAAMTWGQRLKRVFNIDIETCTECGGQLKVIASIRPHGRGR